MFSDDRLLDFETYEEPTYSKSPAPHSPFVIDATEEEEETEDEDNMGESPLFGFIESSMLSLKGSLTGIFQSEKTSRGFDKKND